MMGSEEMEEMPGTVVVENGGEIQKTVVVVEDDPKRCQFELGERLEVPIPYKLAKPLSKNAKPKNNDFQGKDNK